MKFSKEFARSKKPELWHDYKTMTAGATCSDCGAVVDIVDIEYWNQLPSTEIMKEEYRRICRENIQRWLVHQREYHGRVPVSPN